MTHRQLPKRITERHSRWHKAKRPRRTFDVAQRRREHELLHKFEQFLEDQEEIERIVNSALSRLDDAMNGREGAT